MKKNKLRETQQSIERCLNPIKLTREKNVVLTL